MNGLGEADCDAKQQVNPIESAVDQLHRELERLQDCVTSLYERLSSTLTPSQPIKGEVAAAKAPETSPLLSSIVEACAKINGQRCRISDILTRTQI